MHGFCDDASSWGSLRNNAISYAQGKAPSLYSADTANYTVYYDGQSVKLWPSGIDLLTSTVTSAARFFSINFYDPSSIESQSGFSTINHERVAGVSILNKADELANVIQAITTLTHVKDVIIVAHSMGGLDARAYLEGLAASSLNICNSDYSSCSPGTTKYVQDINTLITLDTPHGGAVAANFLSWLGLSGDGDDDFEDCILDDTINRQELEENSTLAALLQINAQNLTAVTIHSIQSYTFPGLSKLYNDDGVVTDTEQSIVSSLQGFNTGQAQLRDITNGFASLPSNCTQPPLHVLTCVGIQQNTVDYIDAEIAGVLNGPPGIPTSITVSATLDSVEWLGTVNYKIQGPATLSGSVASAFYDVPVGAYTLAYTGGGPSSNVTIAPVTAVLGTDHDTATSNWNPTFTIAFTSSALNPPSVTTSDASGIAGDGATLTGTINPNGAATNFWFEWGTSNTLQSFSATPVQSASSGTVPVPASYLLSGLASNTLYYFRAAATSGGATIRGAITSFTTLATLARPTPLLPSNGQSGVPSSASFSWSSVPGAISYRLMVATNPSALPTDPTSAECGTDCILNVTPSGASYTAPDGILQGGATCYWQVHARSSLQYGAWSLVSSFTTSPATTNDFALQITPPSQSLPQSGSVGYNVGSTTTSGSSQSITFTVGNLPAGVTAFFTPASIASGGSSNLTVSASSSAALGTFTIVIVGTGTGASHSVQASLTVAASLGGPVVTVTPNILRFSDQTAGTISGSQTVMFMNTGGGQLIVNSISLAAGSDYLITQQPTLPLILNPLVPATMQVAFAPSIAGPRPGQILIWDNTPTSPQVVSLSGNGLTAPPTTGTIQVNGTLNGLALPAGYGFDFTLTGPATYTAGGAYTFTVTPGIYTLSFNGVPSYLTLSGITSSATQTVAAGGVITYTMNFTAPNDFYGPYFGTPVGGTLTQIVPAGSIATFSIGDPAPPNGNAPAPLTLQVFGNPGNENVSFSPQPMLSGGGGTLTIATNQGDPVGAYTLSLNATNSSGLSHSGENTTSLIITTPPSQPLQVVSEDSTGAQGNGASYVAPGAVSTDGRYTVFSSAATNLAATSVPEVFLRDTQAGTTALISISSGGVPADGSCGYASISANGRYVAFLSLADNLASGTIPGDQSIYVRDLQLGTTEREDVASDGTPGNGNSFQPQISADGRFVVFGSSSTNLVSGVSGIEIYLRDRSTGQVKLVSVGTDGSPANQPSTGPAISADGRYVAYFSSATNLVSQNTGGISEVYVYDTQAAKTVLASAAADGTAAGQFVVAGNSPPAMSADGRFISFVSNATN
ncbi:MAG TPA: hypothetical protein VI386_19010, partial [Candidatus Sulfotelmatobacter sp.]